ncbi:hypothetical protein [Actinoplanes sp. SE50/110]|uniref:hypothetical protein n=1 Tax=Actinoplanes sp. (strain ATCC 31044 / CBS 674.73 / SE50/110) TaxID=134676 RepID=UPI0002DE39AC|nr:hypothetical protein [Actinoplanes sp. SE50/110]
MRRLGVPVTPARAAADWRRRLDALGARTMTVVGDWIAPSPRPGPSDGHVKALVTVVALVGGVVPILVMALTWAMRPKVEDHHRLCTTPAGERLGYVVADRPADDRYRPAAQCNSTGAENAVRRTGIGRYEVTLAGLGTGGGAAEVTPVTTDDRICTLLDWSADSADERLRVGCFDRAGRAADSGFTAGFWTARGRAPAAYLRLGDPGRTSQTAQDEYSFNSADGLNSADRGDVGSYVVSFGGLDGVAGGAVKVTAVGDAATVCAVEGWSGDQENRYLAVRVHCRDAAGQPIDSRFAVTFAVGRPTTGGYVRADRPGQAGYAATGDYQFNSSGGANGVRRSGPGDYRVSLGGVVSSGGSAQVTAYGSTVDCVTTPAGGNPDVRVVCRDPSGTPIDTAFVLIYTA